MNVDKKIKAVKSVGEDIQKILIYARELNTLTADLAEKVIGEELVEHMLISEKEEFSLALDDTANVLGSTSKVAIGINELIGR